MEEICNYVYGNGTTNSELLLQIQILRPSGLPDKTVQKALSNRFVIWKGSDNILWTMELERKYVKALVELTTRSKLAHRSKKLLGDELF